jgi:hypothetical protein
MQPGFSAAWEHALHERLPFSGDVREDPDLQSRNKLSAQPIIKR